MADFYLHHQMGTIRAQVSAERVRVYPARSPGDGAEDISLQDVFEALARAKSWRTIRSTGAVRVVWSAGSRSGGDRCMWYAPRPSRC